jgi:hypothetical protein
MVTFYYAFRQNAKKKENAMPVTLQKIIVVMNRLCYTGFGLDDVKNIIEATYRK